MRRRKKEKHYQTGLQDSDLQWLAEKYRAQAEQNLDLSLEEFALSHGVEPKWIRRFLDSPPDADKRPTMSIGQVAERFGVGVKVVRQWIAAGALEAKLVRGIWQVYILPGDLPDETQPVVDLWHGTTADRAERIKQEGFKALGAKFRAIWFTTLRKFAKHMAVCRGRDRNEAPVVIACAIDLRTYSVYMRPSHHVYVFYTPIGGEVIRDISVVENDGGFKKLKKRQGDAKPIDVTVTKTAGKLGVLPWVNSYLETQAESLVDESHPAVDAIFRWVQAQYAAGRDAPISDEEMAAQVVRHFE